MNQAVNRTECNEREIFPSSRIPVFPSLASQDARGCFKELTPLPYVNVIFCLIEKNKRETVTSGRSLYPKFLTTFGEDYVNNTSGKLKMMHASFPFEKNNTFVFCGTEPP